MSTFDLGAWDPEGTGGTTESVRWVTAACTWGTASGSIREGRPTSWTSRCPDERPLSS